MLLLTNVLIIEKGSIECLTKPLLSTNCIVVSPSASGFKKLLALYIILKYLFLFNKHQY